MAIGATPPSSKDPRAGGVGPPATPPPSTYAPPAPVAPPVANTPAPPTPDQMVGPDTAGGGIQAQGTGTGFLNLQNILRSNLPQGTAMADAAVKQSQTYGDKANQDIRDFSQGKGTADGTLKDTLKASNFASNLSTPGGLSVDMQDMYGRGGYGYGTNQAGLDGLLANTAGGPQLQKASTAYGSLLDSLYAPRGGVAPPPSAGVPHAPVVKATPTPAPPTTNQLLPKPGEKIQRAGTVKNSY